LNEDDEGKGSIFDLDEEVSFIARKGSKIDYD